VWHVIRYPYKSIKDYEVIVGAPPKNAKVVKGLGSAYKTIQTLTGSAPRFVLKLDMGAFDVTIERPIKGAGRKGAIKYTPDPKGKTRQKLDVKLARVRT